jgi:SAM-dependent methyltransferase
MKKYTEQLDGAEKADAFTDWMYSEIKPFLKGNILEVGSGLGTYSKKVATDFVDTRKTFSDYDTEYVDRLKTIFDQRQNPTIAVTHLDLTNPDGLFHTEMFDSVFALNVIEHIENDILALNNVYDLLKPGGRLIILVPAYQFLYNCMDEAAGHYRRYNKKMVTEKVQRTKFKIMKIYYFNFFSIFGWYVNGKIFKKNIADEKALGIFNKIVPFAKFFERYVLRHAMGCSVIAVMEK